MIGRVGCLLVLLGGAAACNPTCDKEGEPGEETSYRGGSTNAAGDFYQSGDWCDTWLHIPNGRAVRLEHGLRSAPSSTNIFVAFSAEPFGEDCTERGLTAPSAGNILIVEAVNDQFIQVRNDTCETSFHFRLTASADFISLPEDDAGTR